MGGRRPDKPRMKDRNMASIEDAAVVKFAHIGPIIVAYNAQLAPTIKNGVGITGEPRADNARNSIGLGFDKNGRTDQCGRRRTTTIATATNRFAKAPGSDTVTGIEFHPVAGLF
jgi:hypothetical protein